MYKRNTLFWGCLCSFSNQSLVRAQGSGAVTAESSWLVSVVKAVCVNAGTSQCGPAAAPGGSARELCSAGSAWAVGWDGTGSRDREIPPGTGSQGPTPQHLGLLKGSRGLAEPGALTPSAGAAGRNSRVALCRVHMEELPGNPLTPKPPIS